MTLPGRPGARAAWLGNRAILLAVPLDGTGANVEASIALPSGDTVLETAVMPYGANGTGGLLVVGRVPAGVEGAGEGAEVTVRSGSEGLSTRAPEPALGVAGLRALIRNELGALDAEERRRVIEFVLSATADGLYGPGALNLARGLGDIREALREQLPRTTLSYDDPQALQIDAIFAIDDNTFWVRGWVHDADGTLESLVAVSPEGMRVDLLDGAYRHARLETQEMYAAAGHAGTARHGFMNLISLTSPSHLPEGWVAELRATGGGALEVAMPPVERRTERVRAHLLNDMTAERPGEEELLRDHVHPAIARIQERLAEGISVDTVVEIGEGHPQSPELTVIVPLYKRIDFVEHQIAHFAHDPELAAADLLYVLDSPEIADNLLDSAHALSALHRIPLRIAVMARNTGYSGANNAGVSVARGRRIVLLNSDVIPDRPGWLGKMSAFYEATPDIGALGPKLLYEDDSVQHAGLYFYRDRGAGVWRNHHYFKGMHRDFPAANVARVVPAVTAACLMVDRDLYEQAGGLSHAYVQGGYEDSDFCLRLIELGRQNWYMPGAELYHLEAQSYTTERRKQAGVYNVWLHTHRWNDRIEEVSKEHGPPPRPSKDSALAEPWR
jgi:O-antigen biosynthesis protein